MGRLNVKGKDDKVLEEFRNIRKRI